MKTISYTNIIVIVITFVLFVLALFTKGFTHVLFLESAVFLISVKLILGLYHNQLLIKRLEQKIDKIDKKIP